MPETPKDCNLVVVKSTGTGVRFCRCRLDGGYCVYFEGKSYERCPRRQFLVNMKCPKCGTPILEEERKGEVG